MSLLTFAQAAPLLGCRDPRTATKRLRDLGVPVLELDGRRYVEEAEIHRAIRVHARPLKGASSSEVGQGTCLAPGERLWDVPRNQVAGRRANAPGRGERDRDPGRAQSLSGSADRSAPRSSDRTEER